METVLYIVSIASLIAGIAGAGTLLDHSGSLAAYALLSGVLSCITFSWMNAILSKLTSINNTLINNSEIKQDTKLPANTREKGNSDDIALSKAWETFADDRKLQD